jgi:hypothetical protein
VRELKPRGPIDHVKTHTVPLTSARALSTSTLSEQLLRGSKRPRTHAALDDFDKRLSLAAPIGFHEHRFSLDPMIGSAKQRRQQNQARRPT